VNSPVFPLLTPGVALMRRWPLGAKLSLLSAAALWPLAWSLLAPLPAWLALAGAGVFVYLALCFHRATAGSVQAVGRSITGLAAGNLATTVCVPGSDEFAAMGREVERMATTLSSMVAAVRNDASLVGTAGERMAVANRGLAERT
jgi:methyl-accepting chemotaxis protein